jgi:prophage maintenance system killer protein
LPPFSDGNKRIATALFLYSLDRNDILFTNGSKLIDDHTLVALTIMIAESEFRFCHVLDAGIFAGF